MSSTAARLPRTGVPCSSAGGCRRSGKRSASSGEYRSAMTRSSACAYGRAATTRSCARLSFEVATISMDRVILRVPSMDLIRPLSSRPWAMSQLCGCEWLLRRDRDCGRRRCTRRRRLERLDAALEVLLDLLRQHLLVANAETHLRVARAHEGEELLLPGANTRHLD